MPWQFWLGLLAGLALGGLVGFVVARLTQASSAGEAAMERIERADAKADASRKIVEEDLKQLVNETLQAGGKELEDALNRDFDQPTSLPADHPLRRPFK